MGLQFTNYTLPEYAFLDGQGPDGNTLEGRTVLMHVRTDTVMEVIALDEVMAYDSKGPQHHFTYTNRFKFEEKYLIFLHFSRLEEMEDIMHTLKEAAKWYMRYSDWEDRNIEEEVRAHDN